MGLFERARARGPEDEPASDEGGARRPRRGLDALPLVVLAVFALLRPVRLLVVEGGSMLPAMAPGDVAVVVRHAPLAPGAIACFAEGQGLVCHRLVSYSQGGWVTQGDANEDADGRSATARQVLGRVVWVAPVGRVGGRLAGHLSFIYHRLRGRRGAEEAP
jgi:hypothetical protein